MARSPEFDRFSPSRETTSRSRLPSPRVEHFDGEVPPALSPLDAFAAQGRLLAKQLDESRRRDRRMSRLPPFNVVRSLSQPRPGYFRSASSGDAQRAAPPTTPPSQPTSLSVETPNLRHQSECPRFSRISAPEREKDCVGGSCSRSDPNVTPGPRSPMHNELHGFGTVDFEIPRAESPVDDPTLYAGGHESRRRHRVDVPLGVDDGRGGRGGRRTPGIRGVAAAAADPSKDSSTESASYLNIPRTLAPPGSSLPRSSANHVDSSDDDYSSSTGGNSTFSCPRKMSSSSGMSLPHFSMYAANAQSQHRRTPSANSEAETSTATGGSGGNQQARPPMNFSRPLSRSSSYVPLSASDTFPVPNRKSRAVNRTHKPSPIFVPSNPDARPVSREPSSAVSSQTRHSQISLPRGRELSSKDSAASLSVHTPQTPHAERQDSLFEHSLSSNNAEINAHSSNHSAFGRREADGSDAADYYLRRPLGTDGLPSTAVDTAAASATASSFRERSKLREAPPGPDRPYTVAPKADNEHDVIPSSEYATALRPLTVAPIPTAASSMAAPTEEDHVTLGIECHENGSLNESTYHLRIAAKQNDPTGMLLYALACRHGWGVRPNQREGVRWLRKALDCVGLELLEDDANEALGPSRAQEIVKKTHRAQFALSVYELGVSHLNGWGIERDKAQALRCFEIAAQWGDADAMAEAGFCYTQGIGGTKDMKKAAKYYRMAETNGMSIVGNSWIYKDKYLSDDESTSRGRHTTTSKEKKRPGKSRTRSIFHRKKSLAAGA